MSSPPSDTPPPVHPEECTQEDVPTEPNSPRQSKRKTKEKFLRPDPAQFPAYSVIPDDISAPASVPATTNVSAPLKSPIDVNLEDSEFKSKKLISDMLIRY